MQSVLRFSAFIVLILSMQSCVVFKDLEYKGIENYTVDEVSMSGIKLTLNVKISNPNWFKIKAKGGALAIKANDISLGTFSLSDEVVLEKKSEGVVKVKIESKFKSLLSGGLMGILSMATSGGKMDLNIEGHIKASALGMTKNIPISTTETIQL